MKNVLENLYSGYSFRSKVEHNPEGDLAVVQLKDLNNYYQEIGDDLTRIDSKGIPEKYYLQDGDVLFISKGANNRALVFRKSIKAVAASAFFVLRPNQDLVIPEYLAWYLNQRSIQQHIQNNRAGTYTPNVNKIVLTDLEIKYPSLDRQMSLSKYITFANKEMKIMYKIIKLRNTQIGSNLLKEIR